MAKFAATKDTWTPVAVADATNFTDSGYMALQGGASGARVRVQEIYMGGQAAASAPSIMSVSRDSTIGASALSGVNTAALDAANLGVTSPPVAFSASTTKPQRSATLKLLNLSFNAFGGLVRWLAAPDEEIVIQGNTASLGEISLSAFTGGTPGLMGAHFIYEPM